MRLRFILGLILLGVALQFIAKMLNGMLPMMQEAAQYPVSRQALQFPLRKPAPKPQPKPSRLSTAARRLTTWIQKEKQAELVNPAEKMLPPKKDSGNAFMQITLEDLRPPVKNDALGKEASARLEAFLVQKRHENAQLADETGALFGEEAKKEIMYILAEDEKASLANARQSKTAQEYARRQEKTDETISKKLAALFEKYKKQFNRRLNENSPAWNDFFKRVNNFQKAAD